MQTKEDSPIACSPPHSSKPVAAASSPPHVTIGSDSMQDENTKVTIDKIMDPFNDFGANIVGNIVDYSSSNDEED